MRCTFIKAVFCMAVSIAATGHAACSLPLAKDNSIYLDNGNGTVTDNKTGLMWQKCSAGLSDAGCTTGTATTATWQGALAIAEASTFAGYSNWRLPNAKELSSLADKACESPAINAALFPVTENAAYWTSSPSNQSADSALYVDFTSGVLGGQTKNVSGYIRLVRAGY